MRMFDLNDDSEIDSTVLDIIDLDDDSPVQVFIPGPVGPPLIDIGSRVAPVLVAGSIAAPTSRRQRSFIKGSGVIINPTISNPSDNGPWELFLFCTSDADTITLESHTNLQLSGQWIGKSGSILCLQWDGQSQYVEDHRNEI